MCALSTGYRQCSETRTEALTGVVQCSNTVETRYNEVLGTMKITLLYQVSHIRVKKNKF